MSAASASGCELGAADATPGVFAPLTERDQPEEQLPARFAGALVHGIEEPLGTTSQGAPHAADPPIAVEREHAVLPPSASSVSAYCSSGSAPGPIHDVGDHRGDEPGLDREPGPIGRSDDRALELLG